MTYKTAEYFKAYSWRKIRETEYIWVISNNIPTPDNLQIYMLVYSAGY